MPKYKTEAERYYMDRIRSIIAVRPSVSTLQVMHILAESNPPVKLSQEYISDLRRKLYTERQHRYDQAKIASRVAQMEDHFAALVQQMWAIITDKKAKHVSKARAAAVIVKAEVDLLKMQMLAGVYDRKIGAVMDGEIAPEHKKLLSDAFQNMGIIIDPNADQSTTRKAIEGAAAAATGVAAGAGAKANEEPQHQSRGSDFGDDAGDGGTFPALEEPTS